MAIVLFCGVGAVTMVAVAAIRPLYTLHTTSSGQASNGLTHSKSSVLGSPDVIDHEDTATGHGVIVGVTQSLAWDRNNISDRRITVRF